jgi:hypothetical protein
VRELAIYPSRYCPSGEAGRFHNETPHGRTCRDLQSRFAKVASVEGGAVEEAVIEKGLGAASVKSAPQPHTGPTPASERLRPVISGSGEVRECVAAHLQR